MMKIVKLFAKPKLKSPVMLASWPGVGNVSLLNAAYLKKKLAFKDLAAIDATYFFEPTGVMAEDGIVEEPRYPQSSFYYWKNKAIGNDIILFIGEDQPATKARDLAHAILDTAAKFQVQKIYTCAAAVTRIHHTEEPRVWGVATSHGVADELRKYELVQEGTLQIAGLNGLLLGIAKEREMDGICLLGEVPSYATQIQNPIAALAVLRVLTDILGIDVDLEEMTQAANETRERMKQAAAIAMGEYIDYFTEPIWEQEDEDGDGEEGEGEEEENDE
jgi:uncharacterized protein